VVTWLAIIEDGHIRGETPQICLIGVGKPLFADLSLMNQTLE